MSCNVDSQKTNDISWFRFGFQSVSPHKKGETPIKVLHTKPIPEEDKKYGFESINEIVVPESEGSASEKNATPDTGKGSN